MPMSMFTSFGWAAMFTFKFQLYFVPVCKNIAVQLQVPTPSN